MSSWMKIVLAVMVMSAAGASSLGQCPAAINVTTESRVCGVRITWAPDPSQPAATAWMVYRNTSPSPALSTLLDTRGPGTFEYFDSVAPSGGTYYYFVRGVSNTCAVGPPSAFVAGQADSQAVTSTRAAVTGCGAVTITWDGKPGITQYRVQRQYNFVVTTLAVLPGMTTSFTDTTGVADTEYRYFVRADSACTGAADIGAAPYVLFPGQPTVVTQPCARIVDAGTSGTLDFDFLHTQAELGPTYQWFKDNVPLTLGGRITANGGSLQFSSFTSADIGSYTARVSTQCGTAITTRVLAVRPSPCTADFNQSGGVTVQDLFDFVAAFFAGCP